MNIQLFVFLKFDRRYFCFGINFSSGSRTYVTMTLLLLRVLSLLLLLLLLLPLSFWWHYIDFCKYFLPKKKTPNKKPTIFTSRMILSKWCCKVSSVSSHSIHSAFRSIFQSFFQPLDLKIVIVCSKNLSAETRLTQNQ